MYKENINNYYKIYLDIMKNVDNKNRNYEILNNIIEIDNNDIMNDIKRIMEEKTIKNRVNIILDITNNYDFMNKDEITLIYQTNNNKAVKIFDSGFVNNNKKICKIILENREIELKEYLDIKPNNEKLEIKLKGIKNITNANKMFYECSSLLSMPDINNWNLKNVTEMNDMFKGCNQSLIIPEIFVKNQVKIS